MELPVSFADYTRTLLGDEDYKELVTSLESEQSVSIRLNPLKPFAFRSGEHAVPWCTSGFYLEERPTFTFDPLFHAGCYYVQEASSMFVEQALKQYMGEEPVVMLDLCAAPGGKSTHIRSLLPDNSLLIANEVIRNRSQILAENLTKWGHPDVVVTNSDPSDFTPLEDFFDVILTDVPCSGEGMFRKDPVAISEWSPENVEICRQRQRRIIADIWPCLKPGGILIYSTCTYNTKENEENIRWIRDEFGAEVLPLDVAEEWNITGNLLGGEGESLKGFPVYHFLPHKTKGEGFFLAALRKPEVEEEENVVFSFSKVKAAKKKDKKGGAVTSSPVSKENRTLAGSWLNSENAERYALLAEEKEVKAFPQQYMDELAAMKQYLKVVQAGVLIGEVKGKDLSPAHALAMSASLLRQDAFDTEEVSYEQAIAYLRKEAIALSETAPRGYVLLTYRNIPLGFVKNIGNRANNLYPQEWRIRSGYLPEEIRTF